MNNWIADAILEDIRQDEINKKKSGYFPFETISKVPYVQIPGLNEEKCLKLQEEAKNVLKLSRNIYNFAEVAIVYDIEDTESSGIIQNETNTKVDIFQNEKICNMFKKNSELKRMAIVCLHNHPNDSLFSLNDLYLFTKYACITIMEIVNTKGEVAILKKDSFMELNNLVYNHISATASDFSKRCADYMQENGKNSFQLGRVLSVEERKEIINSIYSDFSLLGIHYSGYINQDWIEVNNSQKENSLKLSCIVNNDCLNNMGELYKDNGEDNYEYE